MIMLHEFGHFFAAKRSGMKVTEFFLGFGPRVWSFRRGETEYGVKAIPLGGYCRIIGMTNLEEVDPEDEPRTYRAGVRVGSVGPSLAGSTMHFIIAFVLIFCVAHRRAGESPARRRTLRDVVAGSPAAEARICSRATRFARDRRAARSTNWDDRPDAIARPGRASPSGSSSTATAQAADDHGHA